MAEKPLAGLGRFDQMSVVVAALALVVVATTLAEQPTPCSSPASWATPPEILDGALSLARSAGP